jgi:solute carrier family 25 S-adenosylmethionine transporter 26
MIETTSAVVVDVPIAAGDSNVDKTRTMTAFQESLSGFVSGSAVSIAKTLVKYPLDTVTVRLQMPNSRYGWHDVPTLFGGCLDGVLAPLLSNVPSAGVFFAIKDATKSALYGSGQDLPKWAITMMAVGAAQPPYWLLRNPSEVVKTRLQVGSVGYGRDMSTIDAFRLALGFAYDDERNDGDDDDDVDGNGNGKKCARKDDDDNDNNNNNAIMDGVSGLYVGYGENIMYAYPADIIKFGIYEYLTGGGTSGAVSPANGALCGALSTAISQFVTTPLDVLRNRIMAEVTTTTTKSSSPSYVADCDDDRENDARVAIRAGPSYVDRLTKIATEEGTGALFAGSWPRVAKAMLSGAIQFATYEETKQKMSEMFIGRR